jgi:hypothetical protein
MNTPYGEEFLTQYKGGEELNALATTQGDLYEISAYAVRRYVRYLKGKICII